MSDFASLHVKRDPWSCGPGWDAPGVGCPPSAALVWGPGHSTRWAPQVALVVKPPANALDAQRCRIGPWVGACPGGGHGNPLQHARLERSQQGTATRSSTLAWRDPSRARQPAPAFSPGEIPRTEEPSGLQPMGSQRIGHNRSNSAGTQACSGVGTGGCARCERTLRGKESAKASQVAPGVKNLLRPPKGRQG